MTEKGFAERLKNIKKGVSYGTGSVAAQKREFVGEKTTKEPSKTFDRKVNHPRTKTVFGKRQTS